MVIGSIGNLIGGAGELLGKGVSSVGDLIGLGKVPMGDKSASDRIADVVKSPFTLVDKVTDYRPGQGLRNLVEYGRELQDMANNISPEQRAKMNKIRDVKLDEDLKDQNNRTTQRTADNNFAQARIDNMKAATDYSKAQTERTKEQTKVIIDDNERAKESHNLSLESIKITNAINQERLEEAKTKNLIAKDNIEFSNYGNSVSQAMFKYAPEVWGLLTSEQQAHYSRSPLVRDMYETNKVLEKYQATPTDKNTQKEVHDFFKARGQEIVFNEHGTAYVKTASGLEEITPKITNNYLGQLTQSVANELYAQARANNPTPKTHYDIATRGFAQKFGKILKTTEAYNEINNFMSLFSQDEQNNFFLHQGAKYLSGDKLSQQEKMEILQDFLPVLESKGYKISQDQEGRPILINPQTDEVYLGYESIARHFASIDNISQGLEKKYENLVLKSNEALREYLLADIEEENFEKKEGESKRSEVRAEVEFLKERKANGYGHPEYIMHAAQQLINQAKEKGFTEEQLTELGDKFAETEHKAWDELYYKLSQLKTDEERLEAVEEYLDTINDFSHDNQRLPFKLSAEYVLPEDVVERLYSREDPEKSWLRRKVERLYSLEDSKKSFLERSVESLINLLGGGNKEPTNKEPTNKEKLNNYQKNVKHQLKVDTPKLDVPKNLVL